MTVDATPPTVLNCSVCGKAARFVRPIITTDAHNQIISSPSFVCIECAPIDNPKSVPVSNGIIGDLVEAREQITRREEECNRAYDTIRQMTDTNVALIAERDALSAKASDAFKHILALSTAALMAVVSRDQALEEIARLHKECDELRAKLRARPVL